MSDRLPSELWRLIFREATCVPNLLSTEWDYDPDEHIWDDWGSPSPPHYVDMSATTITTKRAIAGVCKSWRDVGVEFLYESIEIPEDPTGPNARIGTLASIFERSTSDGQLRVGHMSSSASLGYGWWTKRIACANDFPSSDEEAKDLFSLLGLCHNLQIFSMIKMRGRGQPCPRSYLVGLSSLLESRFAHSLRRVEYYTRPPRFRDDTSTASTIPRVPGLTCLGIVVREGTAVFDIPECHLESFRSVTTLTIRLPSDILNLPSHWTFSSLLSLAIRNVATGDIPALVPFVKRHRDTLIHLYISTIGETGNDLMLTLLSETPNVRSMALDDSGFLHWMKAMVGRASSSDDPAFSFLTHIGVTPLADEQASEDWAEEGEQSAPSRTRRGVELMLEAGLFPKLKVMLVRNMGSIVEEPSWSVIADKCKARSIQLKDQTTRMARSI